MYRAFELYERSRTPLFRDDYARAFLPKPLDVAVRASRLPIVREVLVRYADSRAPGARTSAIARTAFIDDVVRKAVVTGTRQLVVLGAGYDCRAHRMPELAGVTIYEVDRADTQQAKRERLGHAHGEIRHDVHYVPVDFLRDDVATSLAAAGWSASAPTLIIWEGVTNYLSEDAVSKVLRWVGSTCPGTSIVFTYIHAGVVTGEVHFDGASKLVDGVRELGEPWTFGLWPQEVPSFVAKAGLSLRSDLGADDYRRQYLGPGDHTGYAFYRIAVCDVQR